MTAALRTNGRSPLVEREDELGQLRGSLDLAGRGAGSLVVIVGAAGTGKSALLRAVVDHARRRRLTVLRARGSELEQELSFGAIRQLFDPLLQPGSARRRSDLLSGAAAAAARLFSDAPLDDGAGDRSFATLHGLFWLTAGIAGDRAAILAVDDVHWVDPPSLRALHYLAARIADLPVVLAVTLRPHEAGPSAELAEGIVQHPDALRLELSSLRPAGVGTIVRSLHPDASDDLCKAFHQASAGNPFYLHELLRSVAPAGGAPPSVAAVRKAAVATVGDHVLRRIGALGPAAPDLAAAMSVLGASGRIEHAAALAGLELDIAAQASLAMRRADVLAAEDPFEWIHPLVRRSIYDSLTITQRDALHARAAQVLADDGFTASVVAPHLSALRPAGSARVAHGLLAAVDEALSRDAPDVAVGLLERALEEQAPDPPRATLLLKLGQVEVSRRNSAAGEILREARELTDDPVEQALASLALSESLVFEGRWDAAAGITAQALEDAKRMPDELALELELARALVCAYDPTLADQFWRDRRRLVSLARGDSWPAHALAAALAITSGFGVDHVDEVIPLCDQALAGGVLLSQRGAGAFASGHVMSALIEVEEYDRVLALADEVESAARAQGSIANVIAATIARGWTASRRGDLASGEEILRPVVDTASENGMLLLLVNVLWWLTDVILERPGGEDLAALVEGLELPEAFAAAAGGAWLYSVRGRLRALRGARAEAESDLRQAADVFARIRLGPMPDPSRSALALVLDPERRDEARALVAEELELANVSGFARPRGVALRAAALLADGDEGIELLEQSVELLADSPARYEHARSLVELGALLRRRGRRRAGRQPLEMGMELAHRCGAERLVARARDELLAAGARPRRIVRSGFDGLTASERRIVRLAADGRSNPEIAQTLYVTLKTVETHLSNAYAKLGVSGAGARSRLSEVVAQAAAA